MRRSERRKVHILIFYQGTGGQSTMGEGDDGSWGLLVADARGKRAEIKGLSWKKKEK